MKCIQFLLANFNSIEHIEILIKSLRTHRPGFTYEILACDNGSTDGSDLYLESLEEVHLWRLEDRPVSNRQQEYEKAIVHYSLKNYMHQYFENQFFLRDGRSNHYESLNFLISKVTSPFFATIDSDIEFLGPNWIEPFLLPMLINSSLEAVGVEEFPIELKIGGFLGKTKKRMHPCFAFYRTKHVLNKILDWSPDLELELRLLLIHKSLVENHEQEYQLGDVGYKVLDSLTNFLFIDHDVFYSNIRHFFGATVRRDYETQIWSKWLESISSIEELYLYAKHNVDYAKLGNYAIESLKEYWSKQNPPFPKNDKIKLIHF